jgi:hypothetical protein
MEARMCAIDALKGVFHSTSHTEDGITAGTLAELYADAATLASGEYPVAASDITRLVVGLQATVSALCPQHDLVRLKFGSGPAPVAKSLKARASQGAGRGTGTDEPVETGAAAAVTSEASASEASGPASTRPRSALLTEVHAFQAWCLLALSVYIAVGSGSGSASGSGSTDVGGSSQADASRGAESGGGRPAAGMEVGGGGDGEAGGPVIRRKDPRSRSEGAASERNAKYLSAAVSSIISMHDMVRDKRPREDASTRSVSFDMIVATSLERNTRCLFDMLQMCGRMQDQVWYFMNIDC